MPNSTTPRTTPDPWAAAKLSTNPDELTRLCRHAKYPVRIMAASNPHTPIVDRAALLADPDPRVRQAALCAEPPLPWHHIREQISRLADAGHYVIAMEPLLCELVRQARASEIPDEDVASLISTNGLLSESTWTVRLTRHTTQDIPHLGVDTFAAAANHPSSAVRGNIASHPHCPEEVLIVLADDPNPRICSALAARTALPGDVILALALRSERSIREEVAHHHGGWLFAHASPSILALYAHDTQDSHLLCTLALHVDPTVRRAAAKNPLTLTRRTLMKQLGQDVDGDVRLIAAGTFDFDLVSHLTSDPSPEVRCALASNAHIDATSLSLLASDTDPRVAHAAGERLLLALAA